jgi:lipid II:glycine glycyltransferase (peptidoglycan interpeptide bridge formation enzyme)
LDIVSPNWEALVLGDYEYIMPLPVKKKFGISFLVQPPLTQQLGIFSSNKMDENIIELFIKKIPYRSYHLCFNEQNSYNKGIKMSNYILNLNKDYDTLFSAYSTNTKRNVKKACNYNITIRTDLTTNNFFEFFDAAEKNYSLPPKTKVNQLIEKLFKMKKITLFGAYNAQNQLISALCLLHSPQRLIYLLPVSNNEGKETLAMFRIVDEIIKNYANHNFLFDFAGSSVHNIARFYQGFGAEQHSYIMVKHWSINYFIKRFCFWK